MEALFILGTAHVTADSSPSLSFFQAQEKSVFLDLIQERGCVPWPSNTGLTM
jgi:hypothetical protein